VRNLVGTLWRSKVEIHSGFQKRWEGKTKTVSKKREFLTKEFCCFVATQKQTTVDSLNIPDI